MSALRAGSAQLPDVLDRVLKVSLARRGGRGTYGFLQHWLWESDTPELEFVKSSLIRKERIMARPVQRPTRTTMLDASQRLKLARPLIIEILQALNIGDRATGPSTRDWIEVSTLQSVREFVANTLTAPQASSFLSLSQARLQWFVDGGLLPVLLTRHRNSDLFKVADLISFAEQLRGQAPEINEVPLDGTRLRNTKAAQDEVWRALFEGRVEASGLVRSGSKRWHLAGIVVRTSDIRRLRAASLGGDITRAEAAAILGINRNAFSRLGEVAGCNWTHGRVPYRDVVRLHAQYVGLNELTAAFRLLGRKRITSTIASAGVQSVLSPYPGLPQIFERRPVVSCLGTHPIAALGTLRRTRNKVSHAAQPNEHVFGCDDS
jgi:hypothetical protein